MANVKEHISIVEVILCMYQLKMSESFVKIIPGKFFIFPLMLKIDVSFKRNLEKNVKLRLQTKSLYFRPL